MTPWLVLCTSPPHEVSGSVWEGQLTPQMAQEFRCCSFLPLLSGMVMTECICLSPQLLLFVVLFLLCILSLWLGVSKKSSEFVKSSVSVDHVLSFSFSSLRVRYCWCFLCLSATSQQVSPWLLGFCTKAPGILETYNRRGGWKERSGRLTNKN